MRKISVVVALVFMVAFFNAQVALAQTTFGVHEKAIERINEARNIAPLSVDDVFGDQISNFDGGGEFTSVDIAVPGNSSLAVELRRSLKIDDRLRLNGTHLGGFAEWDLDIPYLSGIFATAAGGWKPASGTVNQRCSLPSEPGFAGSMPPEDYWNGYNLHVPGAGSQPLLVSPSAMLPAAAGGPYPWITKGMWRISCKSATKNGYAGQAFVALSPTGIKYHLDWVISKNHAGVRNNHTGYNAVRQVIYFLVSRVEDRFGNWVDYTYSGDKLTGIASNDGRYISLVYTGNKITNATSSLGGWAYAYTGEKLTQVTRPDGSKWTYASTGSLAIYPPSWSPSIEDPTGCPDTLEASSGGYTLSIGAPSGATGTFTFGVLQHFRSGVPDTCVVESSTYWYRKIPLYNWNLSLLTKSVNGPGLPSLTWTYEYGQPDYLFGGSSKQNSVSGPSSTYVRYSYGTDYAVNEGQLLKVERGSSSSNILQVKTNSYVTNAEAGSQNFPANVGYNPLMYSDPVASGGLRPVKQAITNQQGVNFNWQVNVCGSKYCFDVFGNPTNVIKASTLSGSPSKTVATEYEHNYAYWVLSQVKKTTEGSTVASETSYNLAALPEVMKSFGKVRQTLGYYADGTVATVRDGNNNTIGLSDWYRGIPRTITYPDTTTQSAIVNAAGWITQVTDQNGYSTNYGYDAMGRIASVTYPTGDSTAWNTTTQAFEQVASAEYGIPAGHWRQTIATGNARKIAYFDALWRPLVSREYDAADEVGTRRFQRFAYDHAGRTTFASYPGATDALNTGTWTGYDSLGRVISLSQDSEHGLLTTLTEHLPGLQTRVTNPRGQQTTTTYMAYDQPGHDWPVAIIHPEGAYTDIVRDVFGKPRALTRRNVSGSQAVTRRYVYDAHQQLCKSIEPETGATVMAYDDAGNLAWSAAGHHDLPDPNHCNREEGYWWGRRVNRIYDNLNRLTSLNFPDGNGDQNWTYWPDGKPQQVVTYNDAGATAVINAYSYNKRGLLTAESSTQPGWYSWGVGYGYDANGSLAAQSYPDGSTVSYGPNALGQATRVQDHTGFIFAHAAQYYPNGALRTFTYGNGLTHTMLQNARQLPARVTDGGGALDYDYGYDANGNVTHVYDYIPDLTPGSTPAHRWMHYDGLDRLVTVGSAIFGGDHWHRFSYDVLDNLKSWTLAGVKDYANYHYDPGTHRLLSIQNSAGASIVGLSYDVQGNLKNKNGQNYDFDYGNRLREVTGQEYYRYDAHGRRVLGWKPSEGSILSQYTLDGKVFFQEDHRQGKTLYHLYLGNNLVAVREKTSAIGALATKYQHTDALGSPVAVTNEVQQVIERNYYEPYGTIIGKPNYGGIGFTGHQRDAATGLTYMQQRYYDSTLGRFLSVDPVTANSGTGANFNRYKYAANNPYRFVDPDGRQEKDKVTGSNIPGNSVAMARITVTASGIGTGENKRTSEASQKGSAASGSPVSATVEVPSQDRYALEVLLGEPVDNVQVLENSPFAKLHGAIATTREDAIYLSISGGAFLRDPQLMLEEYYHVIKQWNTGDLTLEKYLIENATNGAGYKGNRYEVEAKGFAEKNWRQFEYIRGK